MLKISAERPRGRRLSKDATAAAVAVAAVGDTIRVDRARRRASVVTRFAAKEAEHPNAGAPSVCATTGGVGDDIPWARATSSADTKETSLPAADPEEELWTPFSG